MNKFNAFTLSIALTLCSTQLKAGDIATERTQAATLGIVTLLSTVTATITGVVEDIEGLERRAGALINDIPGLAENIPIVGDVFEIFDDIEEVIEAGTGLAYSAGDLEDFMKERFDTYEDYLTAIREDAAEDGGIIRERFVERFEEWNNGHRDALRNIMKAHGVHADQLETAEDRLDTLATMSRTSQGRMQAIQIGHQIAIEEVKQMHTLRELLMEQSNLHASYFATKQAMDAEREAATTFILEGALVPIDDGKGY